MVVAIAGPTFATPEFSVFGTALTAGVMIAVFPAAARAYADLYLWFGGVHDSLFRYGAVADLLRQQGQREGYRLLEPRYQNFYLLRAFHRNVEVMVQALAAPKPRAKMSLSISFRILAAKFIKLRWSSITGPRQASTA